MNPYLTRGANPYLRGASRAGSYLEPEMPGTLRGQMLGGLAYIGDTIGKPGRAVRGLLGGNTREILNMLVPFSDTLGVTDPAKQTGGRELLENMGFLAENEKGLDPGDIAGFAAEVALDPLTYIGLGGVGRAGKAASKAGLLDDVMGHAGRALKTRKGRMKTTPADLIAGAPDSAAALERFTAAAGKDANKLLNKPLAGLADVGLPFGPKASVGHGELSQAIAGKLGRWKGKAAATAPARALGALFQSKKQGATDPDAAKILEDMFAADTRGMQEAGKVAAEAERGLLQSQFAKLDDSAMRLASEGFWDDPKLQQAIKEIGASPDELKEVFKPYRKLFDYDLPKAREDWAIKHKELTDYYIKNYWPRKMTEGIEKVPYGAKPKAGVTFDATQLRREAPYRDVQGGAETLNELSRRVHELKLHGKPKKIQNLIENEFGDLIDDTLRVQDEVLDQAGNVLVDEIVGPGRHYELARKMSRMEPELLKHGLYANHPFKDAASAAKTMKQSVESRKALLQNMASPDVRGIYTKKGAENAGPSVKEFLKKLGYDQKQALNEVLPNLNHNMDWKAISKMHIRKDVADQIMRAQDAIANPRVVGEIMGTVDSVTNLFKAAVLSWPARHVRDMTSALYRNFVAGNFSIGSTTDVARVMKGGVVKDWKSYAKNPAFQKELSRRGMAETPENITDLIRENLRAYGLSGSRQMELTPIGSAADELFQFPGGVTGKEKSQLNPFRDVKMGGWQVRGVSTKKMGFSGQQLAKETTHPIVKTSENLGALQESIVRGAPWLKMIKEGADPAQAAKIVTASQVDYGGRALSQFERSAMLRLFPFYRFMRGNVPWTLKHLAERPGGRMGQTIRAGTNMSGAGEEIVPDYVGEKISIPLGHGPQGDARFLTGAGLMFEDVAPLFSGASRGPGDMIKDIGLESMSRMTPLVKGPVEAFTGKSFFQRGPRGGRDVDDLDPTLGRTLTNIRDTFTGERTMRAEPIAGSPLIEQIAANSPLARALTTTRQAVDPRKAWWEKTLGIATGFRPTTVSSAAQDAILKENLDSRMKEMGASEFSRFHFRPEETGRMSAQTQARIQELETIREILVHRAKRRAAERKAGLAR